MTSLNNIEEFLNIEIGNKTLRHGKKKMNKNRYFWFRNEYYIVNISVDKWMIMSTGEQTRELLTNHIWHCNNYGYAQTRIGNRTSVKLHRTLMHIDDSPLVVDHIKRNPFDNRLENLRVVTVQENNRNATKRHDNTSGFVGVYKRQNRWIANIHDNNNKEISKSFTINNNRTDEQCKQLAINQRIVWKEQYNYLGE